MVQTQLLVYADIGLRTFTLYGKSQSFSNCY